MSTAPQTSPSATPAGASTAEPFGQTGVRQYILPATAVISFAVACAAAILWARSLTTADIFARRDGSVAWSVRSIRSRILVIRTDLRSADTQDVPGIPMTSGGWRYGAIEVSEGIADGWKESWRKSLGVEWNSESLISDEEVIGGWWLRVRWRTITLVALAPAVLIVIARELRRRRNQVSGSITTAVP